MFRKIAGFELRYQLKSPVFWVVATIFFLLTFGAATIDQIRIGGGGNIHKNAPFAIAQTHLILSIFYMFVTTAFVANVVVRDDETGFGPILRSTRVRKFDYLYGRFTGAFLAAAISFLVVPLAIWIGSFMPWIDPERLGPNDLHAYLFSYFALALPSILLTSALFFALATITRSMMWTYVGVIAFMVLWIIANIALDRPEYEKIAAYWEPMGTAAYGLVTKYWTASERNSVTPPLAGALLFNRAFVVALSAGFLVLAYGLFRFQSADLSGQKKVKTGKKAEVEAAPALLSGPLPQPVFDRATAWAQLVVRTLFRAAGPGPGKRHGGPVVRHRRRPLRRRGLSGHPRAAAAAAGFVRPDPDDHRHLLFGRAGLARA